MAPKSSTTSSTSSDGGTRLKTVSRSTTEGPTHNGDDPKPDPSEHPIPNPTKPKLSTSKQGGLHPSKSPAESDDPTTSDISLPVKLASQDSMPADRKASAQALIARLQKWPTYVEQDKSLPENRDLPEIAIPEFRWSRLQSLDPKKIYIRPRGAKKDEPADEGARSEESDDEEEVEPLPIEKRTSSYIHPKTGKLVAYRKEIFMNSEGELVDSLDEVETKVKIDVRRGGVRVTDERELALMMYAAEYMTRDMLPEHVITGLNVVSTCMGVALLGVDLNAVKRFITVPTAIDKAVKTAADYVGKAVGVAEASKKLLGDWDMIKVGRGMEQFEKVYKDSESSRKQYEIFVKCAIAKKMIMKRENEEEDKKKANGP
ncbi:hypothetical protein H2203_009257 [Taxawa tesnikishii (nom. ined.)]|nr:hypothetical protein H2203_009257 [Dothideales sp. JES 119]